MKAVIDIVNYITKCVHAISEGIKVCHDHWPDNSPFTNSTGTKDNG